MLFDLIIIWKETLLYFRYFTYKFLKETVSFKKEHFYKNLKLLKFNSNLNFDSSILNKLK